MSAQLNSKPNSGEHGADRPTRQPFLLRALAFVLALEAALVTAAALWLIVELLTETPTLLASAIAILVLTAALAAGLWMLVVGTLRARGWIRGAALTWQLLQIAVAIGCFQGVFAVPAAGWALLVPAVVAILLLLSPSVVAATRREI